MKSTRSIHSFTLSLLLVVYSVTCQAALPTANPDSLTAPLEGTWQLISYNYIGLRQTLGPDKICLKTISSTHYSWVYYHAPSKKLISNGGGSYCLTANTCSEKVDFLQGLEADFRSASYKTCYTSPEQVEEFYRADKCMKVVIQGDLMRISGTLPNGYALEEIWQRVKTDSRHLITKSYSL